MITKHVDILDRFNRAMPIVGIPFFVYQIKRHMKIAAEDDAAFVKAMQSLEKEPEERLINHNVKQERHIITCVLVSVIMAWAITGGLFYGSVDIAFLFPIITIVAMVVDFVTGNIALRIFTLREKGRASGTA